MTQPPLADDLVINEATQLDYASAWVRAYCGWHIAPSLTHTVTLDTNGGSLLLLPTLQLTSLGAVVYTDVDATVVPAASLRWSALGLVSLESGCWPTGLATTTATFTHGYAEVPEAVRAVTVSVAKRLPAAMDSVTAGSVGGVSWQYGGLLAGQAALSSSFTAVEVMVLERYRLRARP